MPKYLRTLTRLVNLKDWQRSDPAAITRVQASTSRFLPPGWLKWQLALNVGTIIVVVILLFTIPSWAASRQEPAAASASVVSYQGRLVDREGQPLTGVYDIEFRIYDAPMGGNQLWEELWAGINAVSVSDGLFNVMLGSINDTLASSIEGYDDLYLGITVGTDSEMSPRVQLGSVPFSMQALTVPDGSVTSRKMAPDMVRVDAGADLTLSTTAEVVPGSSRTLTLETDSLVFIVTTFEFYVSDTAKLATGQLYVDGSQACPQVHGGNWLGTWVNWRGSVSNNCVLELPAGEYELDMRAWLYDGTDAKVFAGHTGYAYFVVSQ